ncbi:MAG: hypothetical protein ACOYXM_04760 [Actinomycetota bacterium]
MTTIDLAEHPLSSPGDERRGVASPTRWRPSGAGRLDWRQSLGGGLVAVGAVAIIIAWWGISGTLDPGKQMPYLGSGGIGGAALIALGVTLLISYEHVRDRAALAEVLDRLEALEARLDRQDPAIASNGRRGSTRRANSTAKASP